MPRISDAEYDRRYAQAAARSRHIADSASYLPGTPVGRAARAMRWARGGSILAKLAVGSALGGQQDWPQASRIAACAAFGLYADHPEPVVAVQRRLCGTSV